MVQVLELKEREDVVFLIPEKEIKVEIVEKKPKKKQGKLKLSRFEKHAKYHEELINIDNLKSKKDVQLYRNKVFIY